MKNVKTLTQKNFRKGKRWETFVFILIGIIVVIVFIVIEEVMSWGRKRVQPLLRGVCKNVDPS